MKPINTAEIVEALSTTSVTEIYQGTVVLTDLRETLNTAGHLIVVRGDLAYSNEYTEHALTPKLWVYENMIKSARIQNAMRANPNHAFFDGVGPSGMEALHFHAQRNRRRSVAVIAREFSLPPHVFSWRDMEIIRASEPLEWGYVRKQAEVLGRRTDLIFINHALHAVRAMAPIGNRVVSELKLLGMQPDTTVWCMAGGSCLYGIGGKIAEHFPETKTFLVEHAEYPIIDPRNLADKKAVRAFAREKFREYSRPHIPSASVPDSDLMFFPLHPYLPDVYLLRLWSHTGEMGISDVLRVTREAAVRTHERLRLAGFDWTYTTALALEPAIRLAEEGKNVVAMVYGSNRST